jgi:hypothetical protein
MKIIFPIFILFSFRVESYKEIICSLQCTGNTCGKNMKILENCANTCHPILYKQCWERGLEALNQHPNLNPNPAKRKVMIRLLESNLQQAERRDILGNSSGVHKGHQGSNP